MSCVSSVDRSETFIRSSPALMNMDAPERWRRAQAGLTQEGLDALLVLSGTNLTYLSGYQRVERTLARPFFFLLTRTDRPVMLVQEGRQFDARAYSWVRDVRTYRKLSQVPICELRTLLREYGLEHARIGMELGFEQNLGLPVLEFERLRSELAPVKFDDASSLLWRLRAIKSDNEIACLRRANLITATAYEETFSSITVGMQERDAPRIMALAQLRHGASGEWGAITSGAGHYDSLLGSGSDRMFAPGDMVWMDAGCQVGGMWSDYSRGGVLAGPSKDQRDAQSLIRQITADAISLVRPGAAVADIAAYCDQRVSEVDFATTSNISGLAGRIGHGIGLDVTEPPHVSQDDDTILQPGMVISIEPGFATDFGVFHVEENVLVTENGNEILSESPRDLRVLGQ